jgi:hypothetical protein
LYGVGNSELAVNKKMVISAVAIIIIALLFVTLVTEYSAPSSDDKELAHKRNGVYIF